MQRIVFFLVLFLLNVNLSFSATDDCGPLVTRFFSKTKGFWPTIGLIKKLAPAESQFFYGLEGKLSGSDFLMEKLREFDPKIKDLLRDTYIVVSELQRKHENYWPAWSLNIQGGNVFRYIYFLDGVREQNTLYQMAKRFPHWMALRGVEAVSEGLIVLGTKKNFFSPLEQSALTFEIVPALPSGTEFFKKLGETGQVLLPSKEGVLDLDQHAARVEGVGLVSEEMARGLVKRGNQFIELHEWLTREGQLAISDRERAFVAGAMEKVDFFLDELRDGTYRNLEDLVGGLTNEETFKSNHFARIYPFVEFFLSPQSVGPKRKMGHLLEELSTLAKIEIEKGGSRLNSARRLSRELEKLKWETTNEVQMFVKVKDEIVNIFKQLNVNVFSGASEIGDREQLIFEYELMYGLSQYRFAHFHLSFETWIESRYEEIKRRVTRELGPDEEIKKSNIFLIGLAGETARSRPSLKSKKNHHSGQNGEVIPFRPLDKN